MTKIGQLIDSFISFINDVLVPLIFALALIVFLFGVFKYFIVGAASEESRRDGKQLIIYSILGFAIMISVWGLVNLVTGTFGFDNTSRPCLPTFGKDSTGSNCTGSGTKSGTNSTGGYVLPQDVYDKAKQEESQSGSTPTPSPAPVLPGTGLY